MNEHKLSDEQCEMLLKALKLYSLSIDLHKEYESDTWESNKFYDMINALEAILNVELIYW